MKSVYMYALAPDWRRRLDVPFVDHAPALALGEGLDSAEWAANEFGGAPLGDKRLSARLVKSAGLLAEYPGQSVSGNAKGDRAAVDGYYRFIEQPGGYGGDGGEHSRAAPGAQHSADAQPDDGVVHPGR